MEAPEGQMEAARQGYQRYGLAMGFKNYQGNPMPEFDNLPEGIKEGWCAATLGIQQGSLGWAIAAIQQTGAKFARKNWNGKGMSVELQVPDAHSKMSEPYLFLNTADGKRVPWTISQTDALATDYVIC